MIERKIKLILQQRLQRYPAVALVGPRQSGKTTLAKSLKGRYYDLEQETDRLRDASLFLSFPRYNGQS